MKITVNFTTSELVALTDNELGVLDRLLDAGDRGAFHYIYGTMSDVQDALLTAKISTFSDTVGGIAFAANWYGQELYRQPDGLRAGEASAYPGIYIQSQNVALEQLSQIKADADTESAGVLGETEHFLAAAEAWDDALAGDLFPGNFIDAGTPFFLDIPNANVGFLDLLDQFGDTNPGIESGRFGALYANYVGKRLSDFDDSYTKIPVRDGTLVLDALGRVLGVFVDAGANDLAADVTNALSVSVNASWTPFSTADDETIAALTQVGDPLSAGSANDGIYSDARRNFSEFLDGYTGDRNAAFEYDDPTIAIRPDASADDDILFANSSATFGAGGNDLIFGLDDTGLFGLTSADDTIDGGEGDDIIWGMRGDDILRGGEGNDIIRGGRGDDELYGGAGDDVLDAGDIRENTLEGTSLVGSDTFHGGEGDDQIFGRSRNVGSSIFGLGANTYTARYDILRTTDAEGNEVSSDAGIYIKFEAAEEDDRFKVVAAASDGSVDFGTDTLAGIERITLSSNADLFRVSPDQNLTADLPEGIELEVDALGNTDEYDTINFEDSKTRITVDILNAFERDGTVKINDVTFKNFEALITTDGNELIFDTDENWSGGEGGEDPAAVDMKVRMILENDNLAEGGFETFLDSINFLNIFLNHEYNSLGSLESVSLGEGNDFLAADASRLVEGDEVIREGLFEIKGEEGNDLLIAKNASYVPPQDAIHDDPDTEEDESAPAQPERRLTIDGGTGNDWIGTLGGTGAITVGGEGRDFIFNTSDFGQIYGDTIDGQRNKTKITPDEFYDPENPLENSDVFWFWPGTFIQDARPNDILQIFGIPLVGGTNSVAGLGPIGDGSLAFDFFNWSTFYARTTSGQLLVYNAIAADLGIGPGGDFPDGVQVIENYRFGDAPDAFFGTPSAGDLGLSFRIFLPDDRASEGVQISKFLSVFGTIATFAIVASNLAKLNLFFFIPPQPSRKYCY